MYTKDRPLKNVASMDESIGNDFQPSDPVNAHDHQVIISFKDQVFIFDGVPTQKVQAVLLLLGGFTFGRKTIATSSENRIVRDSKREETLNKYRDKRNKRCFEKKITYNVRREVALRMRRSKGQFASKVRTESSSEEENDDHVVVKCTNCGVGSNETPMMRKGPNGPKTLCNACGLQWVNKGVMPDISKRIRSTALPIYYRGETEM